MQSGGKVCIYAKPEPLFAKLTKLQTLFAKPLEGYFLLFFTNRAIQSLFAKPLEMLLGLFEPQITKSNSNPWIRPMYLSHPGSKWPHNSLAPTWNKRVLIKKMWNKRVCFIKENEDSIKDRPIAWVFFFLDTTRLVIWSSNCRRAQPKHGPMGLTVPCR